MNHKVFRGPYPSQLEEDSEKYRGRKYNKENRAWDGFSRAGGRRSDIRDMAVTPDGGGRVADHLQARKPRHSENTRHRIHPTNPRIEALNNTWDRVRGGGHNTVICGKIPRSDESRDSKPANGEANRRGGGEPSVRRSASPRAALPLGRRRRRSPPLRRPASRARRRRRRKAGGGRTRGAPLQVGGGGGLLVPQPGRMAAGAILGAAPGGRLLAAGGQRAGLGSVSVRTKHGGTLAHRERPPFSEGHTQKL